MSTLHRLDSPVFWTSRRVLALALTLGCMLAGLVLVGAYVLHVSTRDCGTVAQLEVVIQRQSERGLKTLGTRGGIGYAYYHSHPSELARARAQLVQQIADFKPKSCSGPF